MKHVRKILMTVTISAIFFSCQKEELPIESTITTTTSTNQVKALNGILIIQNKEAFTKISNEINQMEPEELIEWQKSMNFKSVEFIKIENCNEITDYYNGFLANGIDMQELEMMMQDGQIPRYPEYTNELINKGIVKEEIIDNEIYLNFTQDCPVNTWLVNTDGMVLVNDTLYEYKNNAIKFKANSTVFHANELKAATSPNADQSISISHIVKIDNNLSNATMFTINLPISDASSGSNCTSWGCKKVQSQLRMQRIVTVSEGVTYATNELYMENNKWIKQAGVWFESGDKVVLMGHIPWQVSQFINGNYSVYYGGTRNINATEGYKWISIFTDNSVTNYSHSLGNTPVYNDDWSFKYWDGFFKTWISGQESANTYVYQNGIVTTHRFGLPLK